jgi:hypothetical protein
MKILFATVVALTMSAAALSHPRHNESPLGPTERHLILLSRAAVAKSLGSATIVSDDRFTGTTTAQVNSATATLINPKATISGDRATVTGRTVFKHAPIDLRTADNSSPVTLSFVKRAGRWQLVDLCVGSCSP